MAEMNRNISVLSARKDYFRNIWHNEINWENEDVSGILTEIMEQPRGNDQATRRLTALDDVIADNMLVDLSRIEQAATVVVTYCGCYGMAIEDQPRWKRLMKMYAKEIRTNPEHTSVIGRTVYRGSCAKGIAGMSWSLDKSVARKFGGVLSQRVVTEDELLCCVGGHEQEVILDIRNM